jgi:hypothetical protein
VSEEQVASKFRVEEQAKQETSVKQAMFAACFMLISCLANYSTLKTEATCSSKKSDDFQRIKPRYIPYENAYKSSWKTHGLSLEA